MQITLNFSIRLIDVTLTGITTLGQSGPKSNGNEGVTPYSPNLQNCGLSIRMSHSRTHLFLAGLEKLTSLYFKPY